MLKALKRKRNQSLYVLGRHLTSLHNMFSPQTLHHSWPGIAPVPSQGVSTHWFFLRISLSPNNTPSILTTPSKPTWREKKKRWLRSVKASEAKEDPQTAPLFQQQQLLAWLKRRFFWRKNLATVQARTVPHTSAEKIIKNLRALNAARGELLEVLKAAACWSWFWKILTLNQWLFLQHALASFASASSDWYIIESASTNTFFQLRGQSLRTHWD